MILLVIIAPAIAALSGAARQMDRYVQVALPLIALAALFLPHYVGAALEGGHGKPAGGEPNAHRSEP